MSFLQPAFLFALPLIALPILIHLINQNRHRTVPWAATMFLLKARQMARGMARLRYLLLMAARMLAVAGLIFAVSRPMSGGWLGLTSSNAPDVTVIVLDRSASMEEQNTTTSESKRSTGLKKLSEMLQRTESGTRLVLFDTATRRPLEVPSVQELESLPSAGSSDTSADLPTVLQQVADFLETSKAGRADVWVCSDLRQNDWSPSAGRWEAVRSELSNREGLRLFLLAYPDVAADNLSVQVSNVHRREALEGAELVMDILVSRATPAEKPVPIELSIVIDGARSVLSMELTGMEAVRRGHAIAIDQETKEGWGRVELPRDSNLTDNIYRFVYAEPAVRKTVIVSDNDQAARLFQVATGTAVDRSLVFETEVLPSSSIGAIPWDQAAMVVWQAKLPDGLVAEQLRNFVASGRTLFCFPPDEPDSTEFLNASWKAWQDPTDGDHFRFRPWRTDEDLLANSQSGSPLPVGQVSIHRGCDALLPPSTVLWQTEDGLPLLSRLTTDRGSVYFCGTLPTSAESNLVTNGVTFYVMMQRALAQGAASLGRAQQLDAGTTTEPVAADWTALDDLSRDIWTSQRTVSAGLFRDSERLLAVNRPAAEDSPEVISDETLHQVLDGIEVTRIDDTVGGAMQLASEVWRTFLMLMILALMAEAVLSIPTEKMVSKPASEQNSATAIGVPASIASGFPRRRAGVGASGSQQATSETRA
ncbi:MAG: BatA domain-containing protein [Planctomycetaceae bacterium]